MERPARRVPWVKEEKRDLPVQQVILDPKARLDTTVLQEVLELPVQMEATAIMDQQARTAPQA